MAFHVWNYLCHPTTQKVFICCQYFNFERNWKYTSWWKAMYISFSLVIYIHLNQIWQLIANTMYSFWHFCISLSRTIYFSYLAIYLSSSASNKGDTFSAVNVTRYFRAYPVISSHKLRLLEQDYHVLFGPVFLRLMSNIWK